MKQVHGFSELTEQDKEQLKALSELPDDSIDTSEIPEWDEKAFSSAKRLSSLYKPRKKQITARLDADVLAWLRSHGKGYQTYMNNVLRKKMLEELQQ